MSNFTFKLTSKPECIDFLKIKCKGDQFLPIDEFIKKYPNIPEKELNYCIINYRSQEKTYKKFYDEQVVFSKNLQFVQFNSSNIYIASNIDAAKFFIEKSSDCLHNARFFLMKSHEILDLDINVMWDTGYGSQFMMRCLYFDTAITWYSNTFDQLLQAVYWAYELYTSAKDRNKNPYSDSWNVQKVMKYCKYNFVVNELNARNELTIRDIVTTCFNEIEEIRNWANYIKHKGGIEYKYLKPNIPCEIYIQNYDSNSRFKIEDFKSPIEIDIDDKIPVLVEVHKSLHDCITNVISEIDFEKYQSIFGGNNNG